VAQPPGCAIFHFRQAKRRKPTRKISRMISVSGDEPEGSVSSKRSTQKAANRANRNHKPPTNRRIHAAGNTKHIGDLAELEFMLQAANRGFPVAKPFGDNEHYDVIVDARIRIWRVQVKSTSRHHNRGYTVRAFWRRGDREYFPYTPADIDFLAAYIPSAKIWYIIPVRALKGRSGFDLYPFGCRRDGRRPFEKYREAWHLLDPQSRRHPEGPRFHQRTEGSPEPHHGPSRKVASTG
jgi:hypothetical protein